MNDDRALTRLAWVLSVLAGLAVAAAVVLAPSCGATRPRGDGAAAAAPGGDGEAARSSVTVGGVVIDAPEGSGVIYRRESAGEELAVETRSTNTGDDPSSAVTGGKAAGAAGRRDYAGLASVIDAAAAAEPKYLALVVMGALMAAGGLVVLLWLGRKGLGLGLIAGGLAVAAMGVVADTSPWVFAAIVAVGAAAVALVIVHARMARDDDAALRAIVPAVEHAEANGGKGIKDAIRAEAGAALGAVRGAVRRAKARTGTG